MAPRGPAALLSRQDGATAIEYGMIASLVGVAVIAGLATIPGPLNAIFARIGAALGF